MICILAHGGASSRDDPEGGAGSGVLRPRLVTAGSGGPGHRQTSLRISAFLPFLGCDPRRKPGASFRVEMTSASISRKKFLENHKGGCTDIRKFETHHPSQPVRSLGAMSELHCVTWAW